ncbi:FtsX-like permease family protein [Jidongwangia harbinensis]|uniref:FtsX-like permease family protein n=1 Tax=Jidongwangia harbinensis TaxID=2878561 RepID=UPI001CD9888B|nr:ABC transporter permease [Jidongwangia harbinensis]MCA2219372.1 ABC transporter permease [Jidongwangia harbinensis]
MALHGLRHRTGAFVATFLSAALGAAILMTFAAMIDTAGGPGVDPASEESLITMAAVAGGWCLLIVVFAVASTLTLSVRQRGREIGLLRRVGATPGQVRRMIVGEAAVVSVAAAVVAVPAGLLLGRVLLGLLRDTGQVAGGVGYRFGGAALAVGVGVTVLGSVLGALLTARRTAREPVAELSPPGRGRLLAAAVFLLAGLSCGVVTATVMRGKGMDAMQTAGQATIWFAIGLALLAPWLLRAVTAVLAGPVRLLGAAGDLAVLNVRQQARQMSGAVLPVILFVAITTATVYMQAIDDDASAGMLRPDEEKNVQTLNYVVVGMIALFVAIMLVNTLLAATSYRRREFAQQRLAGSTPAQVLTMVAAESALLTVTGVGFGTAASVVTVLPFSVARIADASPSLRPGPYLLVVAVATALTFAAAVGATRRAIARPAVETVRA